MNPKQEFIESGVMELYVLGAASPEQTQQVQHMLFLYPELQDELDVMGLALEQYAEAHAVKPKNTVKALVLASIDYIERMKCGELPASPPVLNKESNASDYATWLNRDDMVLPEYADPIFARLIGYTPKASTAIVWIKEETDFEVHNDEHENFLILEGTCYMVVEDKRYSLGPGDFFAVPLHAAHKVEVTSNVPCKAILQRLSVD